MAARPAHSAQLAAPSPAGRRPAIPISGSSRRRPAVLLTLGLGLVALVWGLAGLRQIFDRERDEARAAMKAEEAALIDRAGRELRRKLLVELEAAGERIEGAARDPLLPDHGLYMRRGRNVLLPRRASPHPGEGGPARDLYARLFDPRAPLPHAEGDEVWAMRLRLLRDLQEAILRGGEVEQGFRVLLTHRARYRLATERDLPFQVALLDFFVAQGSPDRRFLGRLVRDGVTASDGTHLPGLQRQLLSRLDRFTEADLGFFTERILALSLAGGVPHDDFLARLGELGLCEIEQCRQAAPAAFQGPLPAAEVLPGRGEAVLAGEGWVLRARGNAVEGVRLDLRAIVEEVGQAMREEGLFQEEDRLAPASTSGPLGALELRLSAPRLALAEKEIQRRYLLKMGLGGLLGISTIGIVALVGLLVVRERRYLALRSDFVAAVSHELRTPLASLRLLAETLDRRLDGNPQARDYPARMVREADRLSLMVENILSFNRLETGRSVVRPSHVDPAEVAESLREDLAPYLRGELEMDTAGAAGTSLEADPDLFRLLLLNLLSNACRHNQRDPVRVALTAERVGGQVVLRVSDNGVGVPAGDGGRIFTEFFRRGTGAEKGRGFGLGLAICRRIMALHGGGIRLASSGPGGSCFELRFPDQR